MVCCLVPVIMASGQEQQAKKLLSEAIYQEEVNGDLNKAILTYQQILEKYPENRKVSAEALLHLGLCHEKLGNQEATKTYNRLVNNYPDQKNEVAIARERLSKLNLTTERASNNVKKPKFTKINIPTALSQTVRLSPDGINLLHYSDKKLWITPVSGKLGPDITGKSVQLNTENITPSYYGLSWSADGKWIAFNAEHQDDNSQKNDNYESIYIVPSVGGKPKKVIDTYRDLTLRNYRISLSPDGRVLAFSSVENNQQHIYAMEVNAGTPKKLVNEQAREPVFSPDGNWIAYVEDKNLGTGGGNLLIVPVTGGVSRLIAGSVFASNPVWSPDGKMIAFIDRKNQDKKINIAVIPERGDSPGDVMKIEAAGDIESISEIAGWTADNKIGIKTRTHWEASLYTLPVAGGQATMILNDCEAYQPRWSRDGKQIYFVMYPKGETRRSVLGSVSADGGSAKPIPVKFSDMDIRQSAYRSGNRISPDGKTIISSAFTSSDTVMAGDFMPYKIWKISVDGKEVQQVTFHDGSFADMYPSWSPDGCKIAFMRIRLKIDDIDGFDKVGIYVKGINGGDPVMMIPETNNYLFSPVWSPDGKMIAYISKESDNCYMKLIYVETRQERIAGKVPNAFFPTEIAWSPDSRRIAFNDTQGRLIKIMNIENEEITDVKTNLSNVRIYNLDWSPDGKQFVFGGSKAGRTEFWLCEDFLPLEKIAQKNSEKEATKSVSIRIDQIWKESYNDALGSVTPDGRYLAYTFWGEGDLAVLDLKTGENRLLTHDADKGVSKGFVMQPRFSENGRLIAYSWWNYNHTYDLFVIDVNNPLPHKIYRQEGEHVFPEVWLSEDKLIFSKLNYLTRKAQICSINISDGTINEIKDYSSFKNWPGLAGSTDNRFIAFDFANEADNGNLDINILPVEGGTEASLIKHPSNDRVIGWVPGRKEFLFISDRSGTWDLYAIPLDGVKPSGPARHLYTDIGDIKPVCFSRNGDCYIGLHRFNNNTFITSFNPESGVIDDKSGEVLTGSPLTIGWSPDGQYLIYSKKIKDLKTGKVRNFAENLSTNRPVSWSPDCSAVLITGSDKNKALTDGYRGGVYAVDIKTNKISEILLLSDHKYTQPEDDAFPLSDVLWSRDGKSIFYLFFKDRLVNRDLETGRENILYTHNNFLRGFLKVSPDGKVLLLATKSPEEKKIRLFTIPVEGGKERELCKFGEESFSDMAFWSPDGKYVYFNDNSDGTSLWRIPAEGGIPEKTWHSNNRVRIFSLNPDGKQIALATPAGTMEIKAIRNIVNELEKLDK